MKLKYYLRGMGIGIILTAVVMGFALGGRSSSMSDADVIKRAKELGMVEGEKGTLIDSGSGSAIEGVEIESIVDESKGDDNDPSASDKEQDTQGEEASEEDDQKEYGSDSSAAENAAQEETVTEETTDDDEDSLEADTESEVKTQELNGAPQETEVASSGSSIIDNNEEENTEIIEDTAVPFEGFTTSKAITVTIPGGLGSEQVSQILYNAGAVDNAASFNKYLVDRHMDRIIHSGVKNIPAGSGYEEVAGIITRS